VRAVEMSSIDRMKNLERQQSRQWIETKNTRQDKMFVRSGRRGEWQSVLSEKSVVAIETAFGPVMRSLGYELTKETARRQPSLRSELGIFSHSLTQSSEA